MNTRRVTASFAACFALVLGAASISKLQASSFSDVSDDASYAPAVEDLKTNGIIEGYEDGTYRPDNAINRAEFVKIIAGSKFDLTSEETDQCMIRDKRAGDVIIFPDVPADAWFARPVCMSYEYKLVGGYPDGTFGPDTNISFIEAAKILVLSYKPTMKPDAMTWYKPYVVQLKEWGAIPPSVIALNQKISRGEMADMMFRVRSAQAVSTGSGETAAAYTPDPAYQTIPTLTDIPPPEISSSSASSEDVSSETVDIAAPEETTDTGAVSQ